MAETVLITGATGLLGKSLVRYFSGKGDTVVAAVRDKAKGRALLGEMPNVRIIEWDVLNKASENISIDRLIHAASETSSACFVTRPVETIVSIVDGTRNVLEFARTVGVRSVVFLSTLEVYGTASDKECLSETDCEPLIQWPFGQVTPRPSAWPKRCVSPITVNTGFPFELRA